MNRRSTRPTGGTGSKIALAATLLTFAQRFGHKIPGKAGTLIRGATKVAAVVLPFLNRGKRFR